MYLTQRKALPPPIGCTDVPHPAAGDDIAQYRANCLFRRPRAVGLDPKTARGHGKAVGRIPSHGSSAACLPSSTLPIAGGLTNWRIKK